MNQLTQPPDLTFKQRKWMKIYLECGNATEAAMQVYDCKDRDSASNIGYENVRKLEYVDFMEAAGITDKLLQQKLIEGLEATRIKTSMTEPDRIVEDYPTRHKYLETALKLKKRLIDKENERPNQPTILIFAGGYVPPHVVIDATSASNNNGQPSIQDGGMASEGTQNHDSNL